MGDLKYANNLGFLPEERKEHSRSVMEIVKLLVKNQFIAIIPLILTYEEPENPEIMLDTEKTTPQECLDIITKKIAGLGCLFHSHA